MKIIKALLILYLVISSISLSAQEKKSSPVLINPLIGWGFENNYGHSALVLGLNVVKPLNKHVFAEAGLTRFTSDFLNLYNTPPNTYEGQENFYYAWFFTPAMGYRTGKPNGAFNFCIKAGPSLKYFNYKIPGFSLLQVYPDGKEIVVPGTTRYHEAKGSNISTYVGVNFDTRLSKRCRGGLFIDTYSHEIVGEHYILGLQTSFSLK